MGDGPQSGVEAVERKGVHLVWIGAPPPATLSERLASWFSSPVKVDEETRERLEIEAFEGASERDKVQVWIDASGRDRAVVYFSGPDRSGKPWRYLTRDVELQQGFDDLGCERLAQVIYTSILALQQGAAHCSRDELLKRMASSPSASSGQVPEAGDSPQPSSPENPPHLPKSSLPSEEKSSQHSLPPPVNAKDQAVNAVQREDAWRPVLSVAAGYGVSFRGETKTAHGPTLLGMAGLSRRAIKWSGFVSARYLLPVEPTESFITVRLQGLRTRLGGLVERRLSSRFGVFGGLGAGIDWLESEPRASNPRLRALSGGWDKLAMMTSLLGAAAYTSKGTLVLLGELDVQLSDSHYDLAKADGSARRLLVPNRFQPGVSLYFRFGRETL